MLFKDLNERLIATGLPGETSDHVIATMVDILVGEGAIQDREQALEDLRLHQEQTAFGMQHGIAIPHAKTNAVQELVAAVATTAQPVDFDALDKKPSQIIVLTLSRPDQTGPHVRFLSEIARLLKSKRLRKDMLAATSPAQLLALIRGQ